MRVIGRANVRTDPEAHRSYNLHVVFKYSLMPGGIRNNLEHLGQLWLTHRYHAQSAEKGQACMVAARPMVALRMRVAALRNALLNFCRANGWRNRRDALRDYGSKDSRAFICSHRIPRDVDRAL
jgi:hypothetical protein